MTSHLNKFIAKNGQCVHHVAATAIDGLPAQYFVFVKPSGERAFLDALKAGPCDLSDHGEILASCYGEEPTDEVKQKLKDKYGFDV